MRIWHGTGLFSGDGSGKVERRAEESRDGESDTCAGKLDEALPMEVWNCRLLEVLCVSEPAVVDLKVALKLQHVARSRNPSERENLAQHVSETQHVEDQKEISEGNPSRRSHPSQVLPLPPHLLLQALECLLLLLQLLPG